MFPDNKIDSNAPPPTPFRKRKKEAVSTEENGVDVVQGSTQACMFPDCKEVVDTGSVENQSNVNFRIGVKREYTSARSTSDILSFVCCRSHSHLMKKRKIKRKVAFNQHSHLKNLMETLMHVMRRSFTASLSRMDTVNELTK